VPALVELWAVQAALKGENLRSAKINNHAGPDSGKWSLKNPEMLHKNYR